MINVQKYINFSGTFQKVLYYSVKTKKIKITKLQRTRMIKIMCMIQEMISRFLPYDRIVILYNVSPYIVRYDLILFRATINTFLVIDLVGCCCVYIVFISTNLKEVVDYHTDTDKDLRLYMAALLPLLIIFSLVRNLKFLAPFSMVANVLIATGVGITFYYIYRDMPTISDVPNFSSWPQLPLFFGTAIFALEGIGVVSIHIYARFMSLSISLYYLDVNLKFLR